MDLRIKKKRLDTKTGLNGKTCIESNQTRNK